MGIFPVPVPRFPKGGSPTPAGWGWGQITPPGDHNRRGGGGGATPKKHGANFRGRGNFFPVFLGARDSPLGNQPGRGTPRAVVLFPGAYHFGTEFSLAPSQKPRLAWANRHLATNGAQFGQTFWTPREGNTKNGLFVTHVFTRKRMWGAADGRGKKKKKRKKTWCFLGEAPMHPGFPFSFFFPSGGANPRAGSGGWGAPVRACLSQVFIAGAWGKLKGAKKSPRRTKIALSTRTPPTVPRFNSYKAVDRVIGAPGRGPPARERGAHATLGASDRYIFHALRGALYTKTTKNRPTQDAIPRIPGEGAGRRRGSSGL